MVDYTRYKTETLIKMRHRAWEKYYNLTIKTSGHWGDGMRISKLPPNKEWEIAKEKYDSIEKELEKRGKNKSKKDKSYER